MDRDKGVTRQKLKQRVAEVLEVVALCCRPARIMDGVNIATTKHVIPHLIRHSSCLARVISLSRSRP